MQLVILAAGKGTRMLPLTKTVPKPMIPIKEKPKLQYTIENLPSEITEIVLVINYLGLQIKEFFGDEFAGKKIVYAYQEELNGTAGALIQARNFLKEEFLVMMGDDFYLKKDIESMIHCQDKQAILIYLAKGFDRIDAVKINEAGYFKGIESRSGDNFSGEEVLLNTGLYKLNHKIFDYSPVEIGKGEFGLPQTMAVMAEDVPIKAVMAQEWLPMGFVEDIDLAEKNLAKFLQN